MGISLLLVPRCFFITY
uniref:Uncharacterized protein n=1 Tax=Arundo donax TaxID=35708 RepID=A0A0A9BFE8_ARUDO